MTNTASYVIVGIMSSYSPNRHPARDKVNHYKIMCLLTFGNYECVKWYSATRAIMRISPFAKIAGLRNYQLREYLHYLQEIGFISHLHLDYGEAQFTIVLPQRILDKIA